MIVNLKRTLCCLLSILIVSHLSSCQPNSNTAIDSNNDSVTSRVAGSARRSNPNDELVIRILTRMSSEPIDAKSISELSNFVRSGTLNQIQERLTKSKSVPEFLVSLGFDPSAISKTSPHYQRMEKLFGIAKRLQQNQNALTASAQFSREDVDRFVEMSPQQQRELLVAQISPTESLSLTRDSVEPMSQAPVGAGGQIAIHPAILWVVAVVAIAAQLYSLVCLSDENSKPSWSVDELRGLSCGVLSILSSLGGLRTMFELAK